MDRNRKINDHFKIEDVVKTRTGVNFNTGSKDMYSDEGIENSNRNIEILKEDNQQDFETNNDEIIPFPFNGTTDSKEAEEVRSNSNT